MTSAEPCTVGNGLSWILLCLVAVARAIQQQDICGITVVPSHFDHSSAGTAPPLLPELLRHPDSGDRRRAASTTLAACQISTADAHNDAGRSCWSMPVPLEMFDSGKLFAPI